MHQGHFKSPCQNTQYSTNVHDTRFGFCFLTPLNQSINQSINQSTNQSINQSIDQSINQSISRFNSQITSASQVLINELCSAFGLSSAANIDLCNGVGSSSATLDCDMVRYLWRSRICECFANDYESDLPFLGWSV